MNGDSAPSGSSPAKPPADKSSVKSKEKELIGKIK